MPLGAIVKAGAKSLAKNQAKKVATDKLMGRGGKKGGASKETAQNMVSGGMSGSKRDQKSVAKTDGSRGRPKKLQTLEQVQADIDAKETDKRIVKISKDVTAIAEAMKGGLVLKEKAQRKERLAAEKEKRAAQEADIEKPDKPKKEGGGIGKVKVPGVGLLSGIFGFLTKFIFGIAIMKLIDLANSPAVKGIISAIKVVGNFFTKIVFPVAGGLLDGLISFIDLAYTITDGAEKIVKNIFGEEGAEKFRTFMENFKTLINSFVVFKILKGKVFDAIVRNIKNAFKLVKGFIRRGAQLVTKLFPQLGNFASKVATGAKGLASKGIAKVGGFAAKIFGKASGVIAPAFKGAKPFLSKFFGKIPIVGPLVITIVSLLSGEPATQAIFKGLGAALGGALGTFIPIPILGTLIGETIGVFVGDLFYSLLFGGGISEVGQKLKDTFMTLFKGGKMVADWIGGGIKAFINNVLKTDPIDVKSGLGVRSALTKGLKTFGLYDFFAGLGFAGGKDGQIDKFPNLLNILNPFKFYPLLFKSFFGKRDEGETITSTITGNVSANQETFGGKGGSTYEKDAEAIAKETTYESGEGDAVIIPVVTTVTKEVPIKNRRGRTIGFKTVTIDETELAMYGGK